MSFCFLVTYINAFSYHSKAIFVMKTVLLKELSLPFRWFSVCLVQQSSINGCSNGSLRPHYFRHWQVNAVGRFSGKIKFTFLYYRLPLFFLTLVIPVILLFLLFTCEEKSYCLPEVNLLSMTKLRIPQFRTQSLCVGTTREYLFPVRSRTQSTQT